MGAYTLSLFEDHLAPTARLTLSPTPRVLYVLSGDAVVTVDERPARKATDQTWHGASDCALMSDARGATVLRYELTRTRSEAGATRPATTRLVLAHPIALDDRGEYLMRCDRVEFAPGGEALPHGHKGGGIRCLVAGELEVRVGNQHGRVMKPGDAWFESGVEPVHAIASATEPTHFIRVAILPRAIRGQSSIVYLDPAHAAVKPRRYTVFVDEPIDLP